MLTAYQSSRTDQKQKKELEEQKEELTVLQQEKQKEQEKVNSLIEDTQKKIQESSEKIEDAQSDVESIDAKIEKMIEYEKQLEIQKGKRGCCAPCSHQKAGTGKQVRCDIRTGTERCVSVSCHHPV